MAKDALRSKKERIFQEKTNRDRGDGMTTVRCMDSQPRRYLASSEASQEPSSLGGEPYEENDKTEIYSALENCFRSRGGEEFGDDGQSMDSGRAGFGEYKQRWRREEEGHKSRALSEQQMQDGAEKDTETSCWGWQSENLHRKYGAGRHYGGNVSRRHDVNRHIDRECRTRSAFLWKNSGSLHARKERFYLRDNECAGALYGRRERDCEKQYDTRRWGQNYARKAMGYGSSARSPAREARWCREKEHGWDTGLSHFGKDRSSMRLADYNNRNGPRETLCYDYGQFENCTDDSMENWYNQDTPASKFEFIKRFLTTEKLKGIVNELESEFNSKAAEIESLKGKHGDVSRSLENERKKVSKLKDLCRDRILKERSIFQERIRELSEKIKKYKVYVDKMRNRT